MNVIEAILLGVAQGLTEFIPVSSSGHLVLLHELFGGSSSLAFDVALHGATLLALICFFYRDIAVLARAFFVKSKQTNLARLLLLATIPAVIAGFLLEDLAESTFRSVGLVAVNLIIVALFMMWADKRYNPDKATKLAENVSSNQALVVGVAQALAVIPGVSRSGSTITAGLFAGLGRVAATRFAFLLGIPIITGAFVKIILSGGVNEIFAEPVVFLAGGLAAFLSGLFAIRFMLNFLSGHGLSVFAYYRIALGTLILLTLLLT